MHKLLIPVLIVISMVGALAGLRSDPHVPVTHATVENTASVIPIAEVSEPEAADSGLISIVAVGDIMTGTNYPSARYLPPNGGATLLNPVEDILQDADITFGNLEGTILDQSNPLLGPNFTDFNLDKLTVSHSIS